MAGTSLPAPCSAPSTDAEAARWAHRQSPAERAALVDAYTSLVRRLAAKCYARRGGTELEFADLVQLGMVGLLEAIDRYSPDRGARFETFATYRVEGAILNGLPEYSELQRQLEFRRRMVKERSASIQLPGEAQRPADSALVRLADLAVGLALGFALEDSGMYQDEESSRPDNAYARIELQQLRARLATLVTGLPDGERRVIERHYFQQIPFEEIAAGVNLTKGRVSQLHRAGLMRLRELLRLNKGFDVVA
ncbi:sigma-70 family RNA polymerase sigma factor [Roseateles microcysteis]|uniref:sigma-70 family RNA polymerase sigma factor n=1 Tax=Roseateles microcysteis TaxID=3119057 RepID=UPI002FE5241D